MAEYARKNIWHMFAVLIGISVPWQVSLPLNGQVPSGWIFRSELQHMTDIINQVSRSTVYSWSDYIEMQAGLALYQWQRLTLLSVQLVKAACLQMSQNISRTSTLTKKYTKMLNKVKYSQLKEIIYMLHAINDWFCSFTIFLHHGSIFAPFSRSFP
jgi:hypothetical protein